jgi:tetratricopeptide (TPR) repeat protein
MKSECRGLIKLISLFCLLAAVAIFLAGCTTSAHSKAQHLEQGEKYLNDSKFQEASLEFRNAIQIDDKLGAAHWGLARAFEGLQRYPEMLEEMKKAIALDPNNLDARLKLGNIYLANSQGHAEVIAEAEKLAQEILQKDPNNIEGHILMGGVYYSQKQKDKAFEELNHAVQLDPNRVESYLSLARFHIVNKELDKAEALFKKAIFVNNQSFLAHTEYGKFLAQSNRQPEAEAELRKGVEVGPKEVSAWYVLASYYLVNRQFDKAEEAYKALAAIDPNKPDSQVMLADFYVSMSRLDDAIKIYQDMLAKSPDYMAGRYRLTELLLMKGDTQNANAQIEEALKKDKQDRLALLLRARMKGQNGGSDNLMSAVEDLKEVLRQEPNSRPALYFMAYFKSNLGLVDEARVFASELDKNFPDYLPGKLIQLQLALESQEQQVAISQATDLLSRLDKTAPDREMSAQMLREIRMKAYVARGTAQLQLRNIAAARKDFEAARDANPNNPLVYNSLALASLAENKPQDAVSAFETALKVDATNFDALNGLIVIYTKTQEVDKAHAKIDQALASYPNVASLHYLKAQAYGAQRNAQSAEAELNRAIELEPNYLPAYSSLGALYINTRQEDRAIAEYQKMAAKRPDKAAMPYTMIGILEDQRKNYDAAAENYRKALEADPNAMIAANNLAWLYATTGKGNIDEAVRLAQSVTQQYPNVAGFIDTLGWVFYKKNLHTAAVEQLRKAVSINEADARKANVSPSATYHYHLGMALKEKGDKTEARRELETAVRLSDKSPFADLEEAKKALASL